MAQGGRLQRRLSSSLKIVALTMKKAIAVLVLGLIAAAYFFGFFHFSGLLVAVEFPWQPYAGRSSLAVSLLSSIPDVLTVCLVSIPVGTCVALGFRSKPFLFGLLVGAPVAAWLLMPPFRLQIASVFSVIWMLKTFLVLLGPAIFATLISKFISNSRFQGTASSSP